MTSSARTLSQLNSEINLAISEAFPQLVWLVAEISEMSVNRNGHCYLKLVEVNERTQKVAARADATIWAYSFPMIRSFFESSTGQPFRQGIKIMVEVSVDFHQQYGFSLSIKNINPSYTLGDMALRRKAIIEQLKAEGVFDMNKELELPCPAQRIAIISSPTAAGLQDFSRQLHENTAQIAFQTTLFEATMQGEQTVVSVLSALYDIADQQDDFDLVVIIRGGGSQLDLASFDHYELANHVAQFPLPILAGIGHDKDETLVDLVANQSFKTPTAVAEFLVSKALEVSRQVEELSRRLQEATSFVLEENNDFLVHSYNRLNQSVSHRLEKEGLKLESKALQINQLCKLFLQEQNRQLEQIIYAISKEVPMHINMQSQLLNRHLQSLRTSSYSFLLSKQTKLEAHELRRRLTDPLQVLRRGYALLYKEGKLIKSSSQLAVGDEVESQLADGQVKSIISEK